MTKSKLMQYLRSEVEAGRLSRRAALKIWEKMR